MTQRISEHMLEAQCARLACKVGKKWAYSDWLYDSLRDGPDVHFKGNGFYAQPGNYGEKGTWSLDYDRYNGGYVIAESEETGESRPMGHTRYKASEFSACIDMAIRAINVKDGSY